MAATLTQRRTATWEQFLALDQDVRAEYYGGQIVMSPRLELARTVYAEDGPTDFDLDICSVTVDVGTLLD